MKELLITFAIALAVGSILNGMGWPSGTTPEVSAAQAAPSVGEQLIQEVDEGSFQGYVLDANEPVLAEFYTDECVYCKTMAPIIGNVAFNGQNIVRVCKINADRSQNLADRYGVQGVPALLLFERGQLKDSKSGSMTQDEVINWLARNNVKVLVEGAKAGT